MRKSILQFACVLLLISAPALLAQSASGTLAGKVTNASGAAIPNAAITVTNTDTKTAQKVLTGPDGTFAVPLPPGTYRIDVETQGYKHTTQQDIVLVAGPPQALTITLESGPMSETVEIKGHAPAIQTVGGEVSLGLDTRSLKELPIIDRNYQELVDLQTGITPPFPMAVDPYTVVPNWAVPAPPWILNPERARFFSTNGQAVWNNAWYTDGVVNIEYFRGAALRVQPVNTVQQLNIETAALEAPRGFVGGGNVTAITPGGTNAFHGEAFEFYSGNIIRTRDFFDTGVTPTPRFVYNQPGINGGGAVIRDKTFVFGSYEGTYSNGSFTSLGTVPTPLMLTGNFSEVPGLTLFNPFTGAPTGVGRTPFAGNIIPAGLLNPTSTTVASFFPAPNLPGTFNNFQSNSPFRNNQTKADGRVDQHINDRNSAFLRYGFSNDSLTQQSAFGPVMGTGAINRLIANTVVGDYVHVFSGSLITDFRFGYNRFQENVRNASNQFGLASALGLPAFNNDFEAINISGFAPIGTNPIVPQFAVDNTFNWVWTWAWNRGRHNFKFGTDIRRIRADGFNDSLLSQGFGPNGTANFTAGGTLIPGATVGTQAPFNALASFLLGAPTQLGAITDFTTPTIRQSLYSGWISDTIQLRHNLSLDIGVRYEFFGAPQPSRTGGAMFFDAGTNTFNFAGVGSQALNQFTTQKNNVAPRIGLAYRFNEKTVFRAGYSWQYFQPPYSLIGFMPTAFGSVLGAPSGFTVTPGFGPSLAFLNGVPPAVPGTGLVNGSPAGNIPASIIPTHPNTPRVYYATAQVQREFYYGSMLSVGYVGAFGRFLPFNEELNAALPGAGVAGQPFFPAFGRTSPTVLFGNSLSSNYNSLQVALTKRMAKGLSFIVAYTWSKALGYTNNNNTLLNPFDFRSNYGPLDFDRQNVLTISHLYELPFGRRGGSLARNLLGGWQVNGVYTVVATNTPVTFTADPTTCNCPGFTPFASVTGAPFLGGPAATIGTGVFNPLSFSAPTPGTFGNTSRGILRSPGFNNFDVSLFKNFRVADRFAIQLRGEAFNIANSSHFNPAVSNVNLPSFGLATSTLTGFGRQVNLGFRLLW